jgi:hypothetical protein
MTDNPMDAIRILCDRLQEQAKSIGLQLYQVAAIPHSSEADGPDMLQAVFIVTPEAVLDDADKQQLEVDKEFEALTKGFEQDVAKEKFQEKKEAAADDLKKWLEGGGR